MFFGGDPLTFAVGVAVAIFTVGLMMSSLGTLHTSMLSGSRVPYAMAKDGLMFKAFGRVSVNHVPVTAVLMQGVWAILLAMSGSFDTLTDYVVFGSWVFYALVTSSIFVFRRKYPDLERPYRAWGYPVVPVVFLLVAGWLLYITFSNDLGQASEGVNLLLNGEIGAGIKAFAKTSSFAGSLLILLGLPVYWYLTKIGNKAPADEESNVDTR
jgi:APA family basic amino acid/polyamine antiporter